MFNPNHPNTTCFHVIVNEFLETRESGGSFMTALCTAVFKADGDNYNRLRLGFPDLILAHQDWFNGRGPFEYPVTERLPVSSLN